MNKPSFKIESVFGTPADISHLISPLEIESIEIPKTMEASIEMGITPEFINALISVGLVESLSIKESNGSISSELLVIDPEWPNVVG